MPKRIAKPVSRSSGRRSQEERILGFFETVNLASAHCCSTWPAESYGPGWGAGKEPRPARSGQSRRRVRASWDSDRRRGRQKCCRPFSIS